MKPEIRKTFMEIAYNQDCLMHSSSGELGVKTSLYLVFTAFLFSAGIQTINTAVGHLGSDKLLVVSLSGLSLGLSLLAAVCFLLAARIVNYQTLPSIQQFIDFTFEQSEEAQQAELEEAVLFDLAEIIENNKNRNDSKGHWMEWGTPILLGATALLLSAAVRMIYVLIIHPF